MSPALSSTHLCIVVLVVSCASRTAFSPQPMQLELDVIERSLASVEARDGGATGPRLIELRRALHASYDAVEEARAALKARERGDGRALEGKVRELRRRLGTLDGLLADAGISITPGLDALVTAQDYRPDASENAP